MLRFVIDGAGNLLVDRHLKAPGRGAHVCYSATCLERACESQSFSRTFKCRVRVPDVQTLADVVRVNIEARIDDLLLIGRRAGWLISGLDVLNRVRSGLMAVVMASDTAADSARKIRGWAKANDAPVFKYGDSFHLGTTQGKEKRVAIGVTDRTLAQRLINEFERRERVLVAT